jgi:hypothetical protein
MYLKGSNPNFDKSINQLLWNSESVGISLRSEIWKKRGCRILDWLVRWKTELVGCNCMAYWLTWDLRCSGILRGVEW